MSALFKKVLGMKDVLKEKLLQVDGSAEQTSSEIPPDYVDPNA